MGQGPELAQERLRCGPHWTALENMKEGVNGLFISFTVLSLPIKTYNIANQAKPK